jgi:hypothetical protein
MIISGTYFLIASRQYFTTPFQKILQRAYLKPLFCSLVGAAAMMLIGLLELPAWQSLVACIIVYGAVYLIGLLVTRFFDAFDLAKMEGHLPFFRVARKIIPSSFLLPDEG